MTGPACPRKPLGEVQAVRHNVMLQTYEDGRVYQIALERGSNLTAFAAALSAVSPEDRAKAVWSSVHAPWDLADFDDNRLYMTLWLAND